jgi:hypothetical protein
MEVLPMKAHSKLFSLHHVPIIHCKTRKRDVPLLDCVDSFVDANALPNRRSACYRCFDGQKNRHTLAIG